MPNSTEHMMKYKENRKILDTVFDVHNKEHSNWITTISFYAVIHIIECVLAKKVVSIHSHDHAEREALILEDDSLKLLYRDYKQMCSNSKIARYKAQNISPTIANQMLNNLQKFEREYIQKNE